MKAQSVFIAIWSLIQSARKEIIIRTKNFLGNVFKFLLLITVILSSVQNIKAESIDKDYNKSNAAFYAKMWASHCNTAGYYDAGLDCTNFASQCIEQGGKVRSSKLPSYTDTNYWRPHSATWEIASYFNKYWSNKVIFSGRSTSNFNATQKNTYATLISNMISYGNVVQYGYSSNDIAHSQVSYDKGKSNSGFDTLLMAQHTDNRSNIKLHDYIASTPYTYIAYYNMEKIK